MTYACHRQGYRGRRGRSHDRLVHAATDCGRLGSDGAVLAAPAAAAQDAAPAVRIDVRSSRRGARRCRCSTPRRSRSPSTDGARGAGRRARGRAGRRPDPLRRHRRNRASSGAEGIALAAAASAIANALAPGDRMGVILLRRDAQRCRPPTTPRQSRSAERRRRTAPERFRQLRHGRRRGAGDLRERHVHADRVANRDCRMPSRCSRRGSPSCRPARRAEANAACTSRPSSRTSR